MNHREAFFRHIAQTSPAPLAFEVRRAEGVWLYGPESEKVLDLISGISVSNVGHRHPKVIQALQQQLDCYLHTLVYGEMILSPQVQLATRICAQLPPELDRVYLVNSGSEAVEAALKMAKKFTSRQELRSMWNAYHGSTQGALSVTGSDWLKAGYGPLLPGVAHLQFNNFSDLEQINSRVAAVIVEGVQGEAGIVLPRPGYLQALAERCRDTGALLILDEIQSGFGRTGTLFYLEQAGIVPDILVLAKGMGAGMPIGAVVTRSEIAHVITREPVLGHITTFGGHPLSCAAALASLDIITEPGFLETVRKKGAYLAQKLPHPSILETRGIGLWWTLVLKDSAQVQKALSKCLQNGVLSDWFLFADHQLRIAPPLTISYEEIDFAVEVLHHSL